MGQQDQLSLEEVAKLLSLPVSKVEVLVRSGELRGTQDNGRWTVPRMEVEDFRINSPAFGSVVRAFGIQTTSKSRDGSTLNVDQAAEILKLPKEKVAVLAKRGTLPGTMSANGWLFTREAVENYAKLSGAGSSPIPQAWQSSGKKSGAASAASSASGFQMPPLPAVKPSAPAARLVNEPLQVAPASLELDLSLLDKLEIPDEPEDGQG